MDKKLIAILIVTIMVGAILTFYIFSSPFDEKLQELQTLGYQPSYRSWESFVKDFPSSYTIKYVQEKWNDFLTHAEDIEKHYIAHGGTFKIFFDKPAGYIWFYIPASYWIYAETFIYYYKPT